MLRLLTLDALSCTEKLVVSRFYVKVAYSRCALMYRKKVVSRLYVKVAYSRCTLMYRETGGIKVLC